MDVTRERLAKALDHLWVYASNREAGTQHAQITEVPHGSLDTLMEELTGQPPVDVADAHACCEHVTGESELAVLVTVKRELDRLLPKPEGTIRRVLAYLADTYGYVLADED